MKKIAFALLLIMVAAIYLFTAQGIAILDDGDALYAHIAKQMLQSGDWATPYANGVRFLDKPPMMYWTMALSLKLFGSNEFAVRFPSALAVLGIGILIYLIGKKAGDESTGLISGLAATFCIGVFLFTRMVFPDILFVFTLTLSLYFFLIWRSAKNNPVLPALLFYASLAGAVLTKGLIGIVFPCAIVFLFSLWTGTLKRLLHFHILTGSAIFLGLSVPWHIIVAQRNPGFLWYFFINEQALRFVGRRQPADYESIPFLIFWALILVWMFPWSAFLPSLKQMLGGLGRYNEPARIVIQLSSIWAAVIFVFFSFSSRIEHYSLPMLPPLALLIGLAISPFPLGDAEREKKRNLWAARGFLILGAVGILLGVVLAAAVAAWIMGYFSQGNSQAIDLTHLRAYKYYFAPLFDFPPSLLAQLRIPLFLTLAGLSSGFIAAWRLNKRNRRIGAVLAVCCAMIVFFLAAHMSLGICQEILSSKQFGKKLMQIYIPQDSVITVGDFETANSINFYAPTPVYVYEGSAALLQWGLHYPDAPARILTAASLHSQWNASRRIFLLAPESRLLELKLEPAYEVLKSSGRILICNKKVDVQ